MPKNRIAPGRLFSLYLTDEPTLERLAAWLAEMTELIPAEHRSRAVVVLDHSCGEEFPALDVVYEIDVDG